MSALQRDDLSTLSIFECKHCTRRLQYPIMQVKNFGNICGSCHESGDFINVTRNTELEANLSKQRMPCRFKHRGCCFQEFYMKTCDHEKMCSFRDRVCPFAYEGKCEYSLIYDVITHIRDNHNERVLIAENHTIVVKNPVPPKYDIFYLILLGRRYFLLRIKFDDTSQLLLYIFYYFDCYYGFDRYNFTCLQNSENFKTIYNSVDAVHESVLTATFDTSSAFKLKLSSANITNYSITTFAVNFEQTNTADELKRFECPFCFNYMLDTIHLCSKGHSICCHCLTILFKCPICQATFSGRNYALESVIQLYRFPCKNFMCNKYIKFSEYSLHKRNCFYKTYRCPFEKTSEQCIWKGIYTDMPEHLSKFHERFVYESVRLTVSTEPGIVYTCCFIVQHSVIVFSYELTAANVLQLNMGYIHPNFYTNLICDISFEKQNSIDKLMLVTTYEEHRYSISKNIDVNEYVLCGELKIVVSILH